jgi:threonine dehydratase
MNILYDEFRVITEPGGAAPLAAMLGEDPTDPSAATIGGENISPAEVLRIVSGA